jgi:mannose-6-phosphate isomerase-like protein (cupin superfamily)
MTERYWNRAVLSLIVAGALPVGARAQQAPKPPAVIMTAERLRAIGDSLSPAASRTAQLGKGAGHTYAVTHRDSSGALEVHRDWTDVFIVQSGSARLVTGGTAEGARESAPGEWRGGSAVGATPADIHAGDVVVIPAGTPHQMLLRAGERISYLTVKVAATPKGLEAP